MNKQLYLYNSLTKSKELFVPINEPRVTFYTCGVTVYDNCHIGHARAYVVFDTIRRYLEYLGYYVRYIQNFTDIDDKIINKANSLNKPFQQITNQYIESYFEDLDRLFVKRADKYPKATEYIKEIQKIISGLINKKMAYIGKDGDVYFRVNNFRNYGKLSKKNLEDLVAGARVDIDTDKENPLDFALWKKAKPGEPSWTSPWGEGRPGWHIECTAMSLAELGETIDIHAGGEDLLFPHHENEIAQSESFTGKPFVKYWLHNGFVNINEEKMSKSLNNFLTIKQILESYSGEVLRFFLIRVHYRSPLNFSFDALEEAKHAYQRFENTLAIHKDIDEEINPDLAEFESRFIAAMNDDFNLSLAVAVLFDLNKYINVNNKGVWLLKKLGQILGLFNEDNNSLEISIEDQNLIEERTLAKKERDFQRADEIRNILLAKGIILEDTPEGVRWKLK